MLGDTSWLFDLGGVSVLLLSGEGALEEGLEGALDPGRDEGREEDLEGGREPLEGAAPPAEEFLEFCLDICCLPPPSLQGTRDKAGTKLRSSLLLFDSNL